MARIPRNQLLDLIFQLFRDTPRWGIKPLRERTQQPEVYLKEVLSEVAFLNKTGEYASLWELKDTFKDESVSLPELFICSQIYTSTVSWQYRRHVWRWRAHQLWRL
jgi:transcription initiation factor TFIIF subunit beta